MLHRGVVELPPRSSLKARVLDEMERHERSLRKRETVGIILASAYGGQIDETALGNYVDMLEDFNDHRYYTRRQRQEQKQREEARRIKRVENL